jgi:hypothetical protein
MTEFLNAFQCGDLFNAAFGTDGHADERLAEVVRWRLIDLGDQAPARPSEECEDFHKTFRKTFRKKFRKKFGKDC